MARESAPKKLCRIGEVSRLTGVNPHVLRYWESEFQILAPNRRLSKTAPLPPGRHRPDPHYQKSSGSGEIHPLRGQTIPGRAGRWPAREEPGSANLTDTLPSPAALPTGGPYRFHPGGTEGHPEDFEVLI